MKITENSAGGAKAFTLCNQAGLEVTLGSLGAGIKSIKVPDRAGVSREVLKPSRLGYGGEYHGLTVGRTAGRIEGAEFEIDGRVARLDKNNFKTDNLHGGFNGLNKKVFSAEVEENKDYADVKFEYESPDGEGGYFGKVIFTIIYRVYERENKLKILFGAVPDCKTLVNLTNHAYFNLSGGGDITDHVLFIDASMVGIPDERLIVRKPEEVSPKFDFRTPRKIGEFIHDREVAAITGGYDHPYFLDKKSGTAAWLYSEESGIRLEVKTSYPCAVLFTDNQDGHKSVCLECQYHPNGIHANPGFCGICTPENPYSEFTELEFRN